MIQGMNLLSVGVLAPLGTCLPSLSRTLSLHAIMGHRSGIFVTLAFVVPGTREKRLYSRFPTLPAPSQISASGSQTLGTCLVELLMKQPGGWRLGVGGTVVAHLMMKVLSSLCIQMGKPRHTRSSQMLRVFLPSLGN